jgi:hypothetical protein
MATSKSRSPKQVAKAPQFGGRDKSAVRQFTSWSYSRYHDHKECPAKANWKYLVKLQTPQMVELIAKPVTGPENPLQRGDRIDKAGGAFLRGETKKVPIDLMPVAQEFRAMRSKGNLSVNQSWGFTKDWKPCSPTDWNNCWVRVQLDVASIEETKRGDILHITDNKTGKFDLRRAEDYVEQLQLYGAAGFARMPTVTQVTARLLYTDLGITYPETTPLVWDTKQGAKLRDIWNKRVRPMLNDTRFPPRPGYYCRWCDFSKAKGGPCKY